jgi:tetratricopeptide (TPR) repeat protein
MSTSEPNNSAPPSPDDPGDVSNVLSLASALGSRFTLLVQAPMVSPGSQMQPKQPHVHASPPIVERPASATELNGWGEWEMVANAGNNMTSITTAQRHRGDLDSLIEVSPLNNVGATRQKALFRADTLFRLLAKIKDITHLTRALIRFAEIAYGRRELQMLADISAVLCTLPRGEAQAAGLYYQAVILRREGNNEESRRLLEHLSTSTSPTIRARALQTLGTVCEREKQWSEAARLYTESLRAARDVDGFTLLTSIGQLSALKSMAGDHHAAMQDLEALWPLARIVARQHPHLYYQLHNEVAFELLQLGRDKEASAACRVAMASPIAHAYPEWQETAEEIAAQQPTRTIVAVALPQPETDAPEERPTLIIRHPILSPLRLPLAPPSPMPARLLTCAPIHGPPFHI